MGSLEVLQLDLLLADHLKQPVDLGFLLSLELLMELTQAWGSVAVMGVSPRHQRRSRDGLGADTAVPARHATGLVDHLAGRWNRRVVQLQVVKNHGSSATGGGGLSVARKGAAG